jgi:hypothetical protein
MHSIVLCPLASGLISEADAAFCASAASYGRPEDIWIVPVVVAELELSHIERQIFVANLVERPHHSAFDERPETLSRIRMDRADDIFALGMVNGSVTELRL